MKKLQYNPTHYISTEGKVSIWWYNNNEFWDYSKPLNEAIFVDNYLQVSNSQDHLIFWETILNKFVNNEEKEKYKKMPYESIERGRIVYNCLTMRFEVICSNNLFNNPLFRQSCLEYFHLKNSKVDFVECPHYYSTEKYYCFT